MRLPRQWDRDSTGEGGPKVVAGEAVRARAVLVVPERVSAEVGQIEGGVRFGNDQNEATDGKR